MSSIAFPSPSFIDATRKEWESFLSTVEPGQIVINTLPNRFGKTYSTLEYAACVPGRYLYLSDRHAQMEEVADWDKATHWYGMGVACERKDEPFIAALIKQNLGASIICRYFGGKSSCKYKKQFDIPDDVIVVAPKEYFPTIYIQEKSWDYIILDEHLEKARKVTYTYPEISDDVFELYNVDNRLYDALGKILSGNDEHSKDDLFALEVLSKLAINQVGNVIKTIQEDGEFNPNPAEENLIHYLSKLPETMEWITNCLRYGKLEHYFKPYLHYAFDLQKIYNSKLILLNTSFDPWIYDQISNRYPEELPEPLHYNKPIQNKKSILLHYNCNNKSLSKNTITSGGGTKFGGKYGEEIQKMVKNTISYAHKRNLKIGIITYKELKNEIIKLFGDKVGVISHFGGHQGSNQFDDVDVLIIIGSYHLNPYGLYQKHYIITNEYLAHNHATWGKNSSIINGMQVNLTDNENLNRVKLYKLNEEHQQAIFRSGANIHPGKLVVSFGYVPDGVDEILDYGKFATNQGLIGHLGRRKGKIGN